MKRALIVALIMAVVVMSGGVVFASPTDSTSKAVYSVPSSEGFEEFLNEQEYVTHSHALDKKETFQAVAGLDLVIYDNETIELTNENRFNFETKIATYGAVVKVKKSLFSIVGRLFK